MKSSLSKNNVLSFIKNVSLVISGTLVLAFGSAVFILPFDLVAGGVSGIAIVIKEFLPEGLISVDVIIGALTWGTFFVGLFTLGRSFVAKTLVSTLIYPIATALFMRLASSEVSGGFFSLGSHGSELALLVGSLFGGVCVGVGCALTFLGGGSTGGVDVIAFAICALFKKLKSTHVIFATDAAVILLGMFAVGDIVLSLLGIISAFVSAIVIDRIFIGRSQAFVAEIVSERCDELSLRIIEEMNRTTTVLRAVGGYSGEEKKLLRVTFSMRQYAVLMRILRECDRCAFVSITRAHEINGEGWTYGNNERNL